MTPTEFLQNRNIVAKDKTDLIIGFDNGIKESLIELLNGYHQAKLKLLCLHNVSQRSELLFALLEWIDYGDGEDRENIVNRFLKDFEANNCG